jgi:hypothetical protein
MYGVTAKGIESVWSVVSEDNIRNTSTSSRDGLKEFSKKTNVPSKII